MRRPIAGFALDVLLVVAFAAMGRASHAEAVTANGVLGTAWPFLVGTLVGWAVVRVLRRGWPLQTAPGVTVWFATLVVGMALRRVTGDGTAWPFVTVAAVALAVLLVGWRAAMQLRSRRLAARPAKDPAPCVAERTRGAG